MAWLRYLACGAGFLFAIGLFPAGAKAAEAESDEITLINGAVIRGSITALTPTGLVVQVGTSSRAFPWVALSPGSRYRYDMAYRMNFAGYLSGASASSLTNPPDPRYDPLHPEAAPSEPEAPAVAVVSNLADLVWSEGGALVPKSLRGVDGALIESARFWLMRIGTAEKDSVLVARTDGTPPSVAMLHLNDGRAVAETAKEAGSGGWTFARRVFPVSFGSGVGEVGLTWRVATTGSVRRLGLRADVSAKMDGAKPVRFTLSGEPMGWLSGSDTMFAQVLYAPPSLRWLLAIADGEATLVGEIRMGAWRLSPGEGTKRTVTVEIFDDQGVRVHREEMVAGSSADDDVWPLKLPLATLKPGASYQVKATTDLGPWLGRVASEYRFVLPDAKKL
jgi:hypothetical protein